MCKTKTQTPGKAMLLFIRNIRGGKGDVGREGRGRRAGWGKVGK